MRLRMPRGGTEMLAWLSFLMAAVAGSAAALSWIGGAIGGVLGMLPSWVSALLLVAGVVSLGIDIANDGIPNRLAIWCAILLPSVAQGVHGKLGQGVRDITHAIATKASQIGGEFVGQSSMLGVALVSVVVALLVARRVIAKGGR